MLTDLFQALFDWVQHNPHWGYVAVFFTAALESLAIIGLFLPGVAIMFGIGALVAAGALELGYTLLWAALGAVLGDGLSFWLGRHYHQRLRVVWPFKRYPQLMNQGVDFFHRHGAKSVLLARFIGPVRPILPAVAGMLDMPARRFFTVNVFSALLWAPAYTLPGVVFGASLGLAAEVAGRLAVLVLLLVVVIWFGIWLIRRSLRFLQPRAGYLLAWVQDWGQRRRWAKPLVAAVLDPAHPEARGLATLVGLLALTSLLTTWLFSGWLAGLDIYLFEALRELRSPVADRALVRITNFGDSLVLFSVLAIGCAGLVLRGRYQAAVHWFAASLTAALLTRLLKWVIAAPRPQSLYDGISAYAFPSSHASLSVAVYGFLAVLIARELPPPQRWVPYTLAGLIVIPIAFSRLYLGAHWLSDVLGGLAIGLASLALFGIAYRRHPAQALDWRTLALVTVATLSIAVHWRNGDEFSQQLARYAPQQSQQLHSTASWWQQAWQELPAQRHDFRTVARQPLNLQYAGDLQQLRRLLAQQGWQVPTAFSASSALHWLAPEVQATQLPVLPQVHDGQHEQLRLVHQDTNGKQYVLRLWPAHWQLTDPNYPLWLGSVAELQIKQRLHLFSYLVTVSEDNRALNLLQQDLAAAGTLRLEQRQANGEPVLLVQAPATAEN